MTHIDQAVEVRKGEALDLARLETYLCDQLNSQGATLTVTQFPSGFSNLTYLLELGERELVLRRPPFGANIRSAHDMGREFKVLSHLDKVWSKVPRPLVYCEDEDVIGAPFYVMERIRGVILRNRVPKGLNLNEQTFASLSEAFIRNLAELHQLDYHAAGLGDLGKPDGYVGRQVGGWTARYEKAATDDLPEMTETAAWLNANQPAESGTALIHNDYKYDNLVLDPENLANIIGVLDWEMCTIGDPLMDLGTSLGYWAESGDADAIKMFGITHLPGNLDRRRLIDRYQELTGRTVNDPVFYLAFGFFKLGVICQQIYARFKKGYTSDPRFAGLIHVVRGCGQQAASAINKNRVDHL